MSKKFTSVHVNHEERTAVAVTVNGDGKIVSIDAAKYSRVTKDPDPDLSQNGGHVYE